MSLPFDLHQVLIMLVPLLFAVTIHEAAHGYAALKMGDDTALRAGRLTLNPVKHLDPIGSVLLPVLLKVTGSPILFGYARPVPITPANFRDLTRGTLLVSSAGVAANFSLAAVSGLLFHGLAMIAPALYGTWLMSPVRDGLMLCGYSVVINTVLAIFNLIPVPPLDGSRLLAIALPRRLRVPYERMERFGMLVVIALLLTGAIDQMFRFVIAPLVRLILGARGIAFLFG
jgi:Zn-dependent protease